MLSFDVLHDPNTVQALEAAWNKLHAHSNEGRYSASYCWCWTSWEIIHKPLGHQLCVLVGYENAEPLLIWPFVIFSDRLLSHAILLGTYFGEYSHGLVLESSKTPSLIQAAWLYLHSHPIADLVSFQALREDSDLYHVLSANFGMTMASSALSFAVEWSQHLDLPTLEQRLSADFRRQIRKARRELIQLGDLDFEASSNSKTSAAVIDWVLQRKPIQLARKSLTAPWLSSPNYRNFLTNAAESYSPSGSLMTFSLKLDGIMIAAMMARRDSRRLEMLNTVFDENYLRLKPGHVLMHHVMQWSSMRRLDFDLRKGDYFYKRQWRPATCLVHRCTAVFTFKGFCILQLRRVWSLRRFLSWRLLSWRLLSRRLKQVTGGFAGYFPPTGAPW